MTRSLRNCSTPVVLSLVIISGYARPAHATSSCAQEYPADVVQFAQGAFVNAPSSGNSDPLVLVGPAGGGQVALGLGGSITLRFDPPILDFPSVGALLVETGASGTCTDNPKRAEVSASQDGTAFTVLGTTCLDGSFDLGPLPWASHIRVRDVTNPADPKFNGKSNVGFEIASVSGPGCLKTARCATSPAADPIYSPGSGSPAATLSSLGSDFLAGTDMRFEEYANGSARLTGTIVRAGDGSQSFFVIASLKGKVSTPPVGSPRLLLPSSAYKPNGGTIDTNGWYYYKTWGGTLFGTGSFAGAQLPFVRSGAAMQVGIGANGKNMNVGAAGAFSYTHSGTQSGELALDLITCPPASLSATPTPPAIGTATATPSGTTPSSNPPLNPNGQATPTPTVPGSPDTLPPAGDDSQPNATPTAPIGTGTTPIPPEMQIPSTSPTPSNVPRCTDTQIKPVLISLDGTLLDRRGIIDRATRPLVRGKASAGAKALRKKLMADAADLYAQGWKAVWGMPQVTSVCDASPMCVSVSLLPQRSKVQEIVGKLDRLVTKTLSTVNRRTGANVRGLKKEHSALLKQFDMEFATIAESTQVCG